VVVLVVAAHREREREREMNLLGTVSRDNIELLFELIKITNMFPLREFSIHERRCSRSEAVVPGANQKHVKEDCG
jgi:hypothetical protein